MSEPIQRPTQDELLSAALSYAAAGLKIYPVFIRGLKPDGKKDVHIPIRSWSEMATDDIDIVHEWWGGRYAGAGIGVDCGASGLAVADADVKDGVDGISRLAAEIEYPDLGGGKSCESRTPSGGVHVWYRDPHGQMGSGANIFGTKDDPCGVDGRGVGGTIFMPPTFVPGYGVYTWPDGEPEWTELPEVPPRLAAACPPGGKAKEYTPTPPADGGAAPPVVSGESQLFGGSAVVHRDRMMSIEAARGHLAPLWESIRDTKPPNGLWHAVAGFARAAAHFECFWDVAWVEGMVLHAYAEGGHGFSELDAGDLRAIHSAYQMQRDARAAGDLDQGWVAVPVEDIAEAVAAAPEDAVEALLAEMLTPSQIKERPGKKYLIKGLLNLDDESWIIGLPGSRKSFVALDMAAHVAEGRAWQGRKVHTGAVVIIAAEGAGGLSARFKAWEAEHGRPMPENVYVLPRPVQVTNTGAWAVLVKACERLGAVLVIIDTQARVTAGLDENSSQLGIFVDAMTAVRTATGACVLAIHHTSKTGQDARGHSVIDGAQCTELKVTADGGPLRGELRTEKQKDLQEIPPIKLMFKIHQVGVDEDGDPVSSLALVGQDGWLAAETAVARMEDWEAHWPEAARRIVQVLADQGGEIGLTKADVMGDVAGRWHDGRVVRTADAGDPALRKSTFNTAWTRVLEARNEGGDPIVTSAGGQRYALDPIASKGYRPELSDQ